MPTAAPYRRRPPRGRPPPTTRLTEPSPYLTESQGVRRPSTLTDRGSGAVPEDVPLRSCPRLVVCPWPKTGAAAENRGVKVLRDRPECDGPKGPISNCKLTIANLQFSPAFPASTARRPCDCPCAPVPLCPLCIPASPASPARCPLLPLAAPRYPSISLAHGTSCTSCRCRTGRGRSVRLWVPSVFAAVVRWGRDFRARG